MLAAKFIREHTDIVTAMLKSRRHDNSLLYEGLSVPDFLALEKRRLDLIQSVETRRAQRNLQAKETAKRKAGGASIGTGTMRELSQTIKKEEHELAELTEKSHNFLLTLPNILAADVPDGADANSNRLIRTVGEATQFSFIPRAHDHFGQGDEQDSKRAVKIASTRFSLLKGDLARLARVLSNFFLDENRKHGYTEVLPPTLANTQSMLGTSQLPKFSKDVFRLGGQYEDLYLISTGEIPLTNIHADEIIPATELPICYTALTSCYRSEAGAAGQDTRGLIRLHEFHKVEAVRITHAENSHTEHELLLSHSESLLKKLGLPYRVVLLSSGDIGFGAAKCYDLEAYFPAQNKYREVSSCSNCYDFQARRAKIRIRKGENPPQLAHTLNSSALPIERVLAAILENFQQEDGSVIIPEILQDAMGQKLLFSPGTATTKTKN